MLPPDSSVVVGQFDDCEDDVAEKVETVPMMKIIERDTHVNEEDTDDSLTDDSADDDDDDMEEIRCKLTSMQSAGKNRSGGSGGGGKGGGGDNDGGKNLKFLSKIFVGEYQPNSALTSKVSNELNAANKPERFKTKDKSHRATTEQVLIVL